MGTRLIGLMTAVAVGLGMASSAAAYPLRPWNEFHCGKHARTLTYLFWPEGNTGRGTPSAFPASSIFVDERGFGEPDIERKPVRAQAHLTVYRPGRAYRNADWRLYADATGALATPKGGSAQGPCPELPDPRPLPIPRFTSVANRHRATKPIALKCRFHTPYGYINAGPLRGPTGMPPAAGAIVHDRKRVIMRTVLSDDKPWLDYDRSRCERIALPR